MDLFKHYQQRYETKRHEEFSLEEYLNLCKAVVSSCGFPCSLLMSSSISLCTSVVLLPEKSRPLWFTITVKLTWGIVSYRPPCCFF